MNKVTISLQIILLLAACSPQEQQPAKLPSLAYANWAKVQASNSIIAERNNQSVNQLRSNTINSAARAQLRLVNQSLENDQLKYAALTDNLNSHQQDIVSNENNTIMNDASQNGNYNPYANSLDFGDNGTPASLWQERGSDLWRDDRAWQPMDLITVLVTESAEGAKEGDTEIKGNASLTATVGEWLGIIDSVKKRNPQISDDSGTLVSASTKNNYKGEGETTRKDTLTAKISAMVVEVLPGNVLRIEGEKIIALNQEEQTISISGLVRPRDINSNNEIDSSKIANLRIDYYGRGVVSEAQYGGWFSRLMRVLWPF